ncbi:MAG: hypothetical protein BWX84_00447 [Verrucomicrobia bacterium ADurb.Bin118]|nr:MAG: hypothetical protein BWX84_00447 [Verrucomicrobia bacterium ADurb.Bin118]
MALPALPHAMQWNSPLSGVTMKLGVALSAWNGQRPIQSLTPCFFNSMPRLWTSARRSVLRFTRSMSASGMRQAIVSSGFWKRCQA